MSRPFTGAPSRRLLLGSALDLCLGGRAGRALAATGPAPRLPPPDLSHAVQNFSRQIGWPEGMAPRAPEGFTVNTFATGLDSPRWIHRLPNGDILVAEARTMPRPPDNAEDGETLEKQRAAGTITGESANRITLLRDAEGDGVAETRQVLLTGLNRPFGMLWQNGWLYVANTDALLRFRYTPGGDRIDPAA